MKQFYNNTPVLVTGGAGFIGSHLTELLVSMGAQVTVLDNLSGGKLQNLATVIDKITFVRADIRDKEACLSAAHGQKVIFHLAAFISVPASVETPDECHAINVDGTNNLLEAARVNGVERFVFSSSAAVYGPVDGTCSESMPTNPMSPYGFSKLIGELYCQQYAQLGVQTVCMRYFNVCGERQNPNGAYAGVVAAFSERMKNNEPLTVLGDGMQTRDFVPVTQVAHANALLATLPTARMNGDVFNIATGSSITLLQLIEQLKEKYTQFEQPISFAPARPGDIRHSHADCAKYEQLVSSL